MNTKNNRDRVFNRLLDNSISVLYAGNLKHKSADAYYDFEVNRNFFYLTGLNRDKMILVMSKSNMNQSYLFIEENTELKAKWDGARMSKEEASDISGIDIKNIKYLVEFDGFFRSLTGVSRMGTTPPTYVYLDLLRRTGHEHLEAHRFASTIKNEYPELQVKNIETDLSYVRMIKSDYEIEEIKTAVDYTNEGILNMMRNAEAGLFEYQIESFYKQSLMFNNTTESFKTIAASGANATVLHYVDNDSQTEENQLILCDLGSKSNQYASDITRTFPVNGKYTERQREAYEWVLKANKEAIKFVKPGITWGELNKVARDILIEGLKSMGIIKEDAEIIKYYYHGLGHFLGLDVHDVGIYSEKLQEGMVITIEPGLYIKEENIGIRIEDDIVITKDGCINLSENIIKEVDDIENFMNPK
jgi:Xaa-Pro aminopeptidase